MIQARGLIQNDLPALSLVRETPVHRIEMSLLFLLMMLLEEMKTHSACFGINFGNSIGSTFLANSAALSYLLFNLNWPRSY